MVETKKKQARSTPPAMATIYNILYVIFAVRKGGNVAKRHPKEKDNTMQHNALQTFLWPYKKSVLSLHFQNLA